MSKNSWIILISTVIVIVSIAIVLLLILMPQVEVSTTSKQYDEIVKSEYTYEPTKEDIDTKLVEEYTVTSNEVTEGIKEDNYVPGNDNPFTPTDELKKIEEEKEAQTKVDPYKELTPADK